MDYFVDINGKTHKCLLNIYNNGVEYFITLHHEVYIKENENFIKYDYKDNIFLNDILKNPQSKDFIIKRK